jgi:hypothetical protein
MWPHLLFFQSNLGFHFWSHLSPYLLTLEEILLYIFIMVMKLAFKLVNDQLIEFQSFPFITFLLRDLVDRSSDKERRTKTCLQKN